MPGQVSLRELQGLLQEAELRSRGLLHDGEDRQAVSLVNHVLEVLSRVAQPARPRAAQNPAPAATSTIPGMSTLMAASGTPTPIRAKAFA